MDDDKKLDDHATGDAPKPSKPKLQGPEWMGRPIVHADHVHDLERDSAINEFGHKMSRADAENEAHDKYIKAQRTEAAIFHLKGIKAAAAAGDLEAARKHNLMYEIHSKALGHEPIGPAHPDVAKGMEGSPPIHKFKAHRADLLAFHDEPMKEEGVTKAEALHALYTVLDPLVKGEVVGRIGNAKGAEPQPDHLHQHFNQLDYRRSLKSKKPEAAKKSVNDWARAELEARKKPRTGKAKPCVCPAYSHPHRHGGGKCGK